jgi:hypothetical protein
MYHLSGCCEHNGTVHNGTVHNGTVHTVANAPSRWGLPPRSPLIWDMSNSLKVLFFNSSIALPHPLFICSFKEFNPYEETHKEENQSINHHPSGTF